MNMMKNRLRKIEKAIVPRMVEVSQFHCLIDGREEVMSALEYARAIEEGHDGEILRKAPHIYKPVNPCPNYASLRAVQAEIRKRMESEPL